MRNLWEPCVHVWTINGDLYSLWHSGTSVQYNCILKAVMLCYFGELYNIKVPPSPF